ncbi:hypothetical protein [Pseudomonas sp. PS01302]|uniref:hypothetical protein n=1 Tax=Pseudomonas sp. PS01302 TaxID=2991438 RepID=UPI00249C37C1|nr:hypothetical protein [Pseudomonas sp. PS01302]
MPELMIAVVDESGLEGQDISKYMDGQIALDRFEHAGTHPLFMIFHWHLNSMGVNHSISIMDSYFRMRDFSAKNLNRKNLGIEKISIVLPPDVASGRGWILEEFVEAVIEKKIEGHPTHIIYKTIMQSYRYLLSDAVEATPPDQRVILKNVASPSRNNSSIPTPKKDAK